MASILTTASVVLVLLVAGLVQYLKGPLWQLSTLGKTFQPISDFPYRCRRIHDPRLRACEDMWLSESTRQLFLACSDPAARGMWMPKYGKPGPDKWIY